MLARALHFHKLPFAAHHHVHVDRGPHILLVVEIEPRLTIDDTNAHRCHAPLDRRLDELAGLHHPVERVNDRDRGPGNRGGAGSSVGDEDVAIELPGELAKLEIVEPGAEAAPDQALNLLRAPSQLRSLTGSARPCRAREHCVFRGEPTFATSPLPARNTVLDRRCAQHARRTEDYETRAFGVGSNPPLERDRPEFCYATSNAHRVTCFH